MRSAALLLLLPLAASLPLSAAVEPPAVITPAPAPAITQPAAAAAQSFSGKLKSISGVTLTVVKAATDGKADGEKREFSLTETTKITIEGKEAEGATLKKRLKKLKEGETITVDVDAHNAVTSVEVNGEKKKKKKQ